MRYLLLFLALTTSAFCQVRVEDIRVHQSAPTAHGTNIRVTVQNGRKPVLVTSVELQARENEASPWTSVKVWTRRTRLLAGKSLALDYLPSDDSQFPPVLTRPEFMVRALVRSGPKVVASEERDYVADYKTLRMP